MTGRAVHLRTALTPIGHHTAMLDGSVDIPGAELEVRDVQPHPEIFRRMGRTDEFDLCELSVMTYLIGRDLGRTWTALPIVPRHMFHHGDFWVNVDSGIESPDDLRGKRIGTRNWTVTPGVQDRGILTDEFGVDLADLTFVLAEDEHIPQSAQRYPANVDAGVRGDLFPSVVSGDLPAGMAGFNQRFQTSPRLRRLFDNAAELDAAQYHRTGVVPPFTVIVVHDRVLDGNPWLIEALWDGFVQAREQGLEPNPTVERVVNGDPVPIGWTANRPGFEEIVRLGHEQGMLTGPAAVDDLFVRIG